MMRWQRDSQLDSEGKGVRGVDDEDADEGAGRVFLFDQQAGTLDG